MAVREDETVTLGLDVLALDALPGDEASHVDLIVKVTNVADDGIVLHLGHVLGHDDVLVASCGDEDVSGGQDILHGGHSEALHAGLQGADGVNLHQTCCLLQAGLQKPRQQQNNSWSASDWCLLGPQEAQKTEPGPEQPSKWRRV